MLLYKYFPTRVPIKIAPTSLSFLTSNIRIDDIYAEPFIDLSNPAMSDAQINIKGSSTSSRRRWPLLSALHCWPPWRSP